MQLTGLKLPRIAFLAACICGLLPGSAVAGGCSIADVIYQVEQNLSLQDVKEACGASVNVAGCKTVTVYRLAKKEEMGEEEIAQECRRGGDSGLGDTDARQTPLAPQVATVCMTNVGTCMMAVAIQQGSSCYCPTPYGPVWGQAR